MNIDEQSHNLMDHAWRYFELHANQRMSLFNFFLAISGVVLAGLAATLQASLNFSMLGIVLGALLAVISFIFWKLDQRVSFLIKHAETALVVLEKALPVNCSRLFLLEPSHTNEVAAATSWWTRLWTYGKCFRLIFWVMGLTGFGGAVLSVLKATGVLTL